MADSTKVKSVRNNDSVEVSSNPEQSNESSQLDSTEGDYSTEDNYSDDESNDEDSNEEEYSENELITSSNVSLINDTVWGRHQAQNLGDNNCLIETTEYLTAAMEKAQTASKHKSALILMEQALTLLNINWSAFAARQIEFNSLPLLEGEKYNNCRAIELVKRILFSASIALYYFSDNQEIKDIGAWLCDTVKLNPQFHSGLSGQAHYNLLFYLTSLKFKTKIQLKINLPPISPGSKEYYQAMNPSIIRCENGYLVNIRAVNYKQEGATNFYSLDQDGFIRTKNYLVGLDNDFNILWQTEIVDQSSLPRYNSHVKGCEDCHLFNLNNTTGDPTQAMNQAQAIIALTKKAGQPLTSKERFGINFAELAFTCVTADTRTDEHGGSNMPQVSIARFNSELTTENQAIISELIPLVKRDDQTRCEKNWLVFFNNQRFECVYDYDPFSCLYLKALDTWRENLLNSEIKSEVKNKQAVCSTSRRVRQPLQLNEYRGSAGPIKCQIKDQRRYLVLIHGVIICEDKRNYYHRFLVFSLKWKLQALSQAFYFHHLGVEYCAGMCLNQDQSELILTFGSEDKEAWLYIMAWSDLEELLLPIKRFLF